MKDYAVIGGGIGGCCAAALLNHHGYDVVLLEKEPTLGGCASTFKHNGYQYNTGATTVSGYNENGIVKKLFDMLHLTPNLIATDPAIVIVQEGKSVHRYRDVNAFVEELQHLHPHPKHGEFWHLIHRIGETFYTLNGHYYSNASLSKKIISLLSLIPMVRKFLPYLWGDARTFIEKFYAEISQEYRDFLDAQILIVAQAKSDKVNFFTAALSLGYTFNETHYAIGGMGKVCETLTANVSDVRTSCEVLSITKRNDHYLVKTRHGNIEAKNLIMGTSHYSSGRWFEDKEIKNYYQRYTKLNNHQSAFVLYLTLCTQKTFHHHYQLINKEILPKTLSKALFVSFSDSSDTDIAPVGHFSVTASIHTDSRFWLGLAPAQYKREKKELHDLLQALICDTLAIDSNEIVDSFAATPKTFGRYLNRTQLGGNALSISNFLPRLPSNDTPIKGFYHVGDTAYAAQGWPGVAMGAQNLMKLIHG